MATFIFVGSLTEEDLKHLEEGEDLRPPEEVLGLTPEEVRRLTPEDVKWLMDTAKSREEKPPVFINRNKIQWYEFEQNDRDGFRSFVYADREEIMQMPAYECVTTDAPGLQKTSAEWIRTKKDNRVGLACPKCYNLFLPNAEWARIYGIPTKYCPNCGGKMKEVKT